MPVDIVQWRGEIDTFNNRKKIYFYKGSFCLFSALIYTFVWLLLQIFSMVRFTVNLICFAINSRLFFFAITRIFRKVRLQLITLLYSVMIVNVILWYFFRLLELSGDIEFNSILTLVKAFQFVTGTSIACQLITTLKYPY